MPSNVDHKPNDAENPERWFNKGWRIVGASSYAPPTHLGLPHEITTLVLEHD